MEHVIREVNPHENEVWPDQQSPPQIECTHCHTLMRLVTGSKFPMGEPGRCLLVCGYCQIYCTVNFYGEMIWSFPVSREVWYRRSK